MKTRISLIGAALAILFAGGAYATTPADVSMTVDSGEPVRATLLPTVSLDATSSTSAANPATMRVADAEPLEITLLPTVHVNARTSPDLAVTLLPTVRVYASGQESSIANDRVAEAKGAAADFPLVDDTSAWEVEQPIGLHHYATPR